MAGRRVLLLMGAILLAALVLSKIASPGGTSVAGAAEPPEPPRLVTAPAEEISFTHAKLVGSVNPHGSPTTYYFAWGTAYTSLPNKTPELSAGEGTHSSLVNAVISGLEQGHEYFFQLVATNGGGTSKGSIGHLVTLKDTTAPNIELSGPLTEGLKEGITEYPLHVHATDGEAAAPSSGVKSISILVDGEVVKTVEQACPGTNCSMDTEWTYNAGSYAGIGHEVEVLASDVAGNVGSQVLQLAAANGSFPACSPTGASPGAEPIEVRSLPGGGSVYVYEGADGTLSEFPVSPEGFNPLSASEGELEMYGYPPRPTDPEKLAEWEEVMAHAGGTAEPGGCAGVASEEAQPKEEPVGATELSTKPSMAGFVFQGGGTDKWIGASARWNAPGPTKPYCAASASSAGESTWIGLGGGEQGFFQTGTNFGVGKEGVHTFYEKFYAETPGTSASEEPVESKFTITPGDPIYAELEWRARPERAYSFVVDVKEEKHQAFLSGPGKGSLYNGNIVGFIGAERPGKVKGTGHFLLQDFGSSKIRRGHLHLSNEGGWRNLGQSTTRYHWNMQEGAKSNLMAKTSALEEEGKAFTTTWEACHP